MTRSPHQDAIDALYRKLKGNEENGNNGHAGKNSAGRAAFRTDAEIVAKCRSADNASKFAALYDYGDVYAYHGGDESAADLALVSMLAFYTQDFAQLDRLFRGSALYRPKWERDTYRNPTIERALSGLSETYHWPETNGGDPTGTGTGTPNSSGTGTATERRRLRPVRFGQLGAPTSRRDLVKGLVPEAHPSKLFGAGGVAKSYLAMSAAMALSRGAGNFLGHEIEPTPVGYLDFELDVEEQHRRAARLAAGDGLPCPPDDLLYMCALGMKPREAFEDALLACKEVGAKLLMVDSLSVAMEGDVEAARDVIGFYQRVIAPFREHGIAVLALDHQSKLQAGERYQNKQAFGSVFKTNLARSVIQVEAAERKEDSLTLRLRHVKFNFGPLVKPFGVKIGFGADRVTVEAVELEAFDLAEEATLNAHDRVRHALEALGEATRNEVHERLSDLSAGTIKKELARLKELGEAEETGEVRERQQVVRLTGTGTGPIKGTGTGTASQQREIARLVNEGMSEEWARAEVLGEEA